MNWILAMLALAVAISAAAQNFAPGTETKLTVPDLENPVVVYVPEDYTADRAWPAAFHYHGTNGMPTTAIPKAYTGGRGFVLVGMEFTVRGTPKATPEYFEAEVAAFREVQQLLADNGVRIDPKRLYIGGFSKGGWIASTLAEAYLPELAGVFLLGAGKTPFTVKRPLPSNQKRALYIGVGNLEINYPYGVQGIEYFSGLGFKVTFDGYPGLEHEVPMGGGNDPFRMLSPAFVQWWQVERHRDSPAPLRAPVTTWFGAVTALGANPDLPARDRYLALQRAPRSPFYRYLNQGQREAISGQLKALAEEPGAVAETAAQEEFFALIDQEVSAGDFAAKHSSAHAYFKAYQAAPDSCHGALAALASTRLGKQIRDVGNWRFFTDEQRTDAETKLREAPIPPIPEEQLLGLLREIESRIRIDPGPPGS